MFETELNARPLTYSPSFLEELKFLDFLIRVLTYVKPGTMMHICVILGIQEAEDEGSKILGWDNLMRLSLKTKI